MADVGASGGGGDGVCRWSGVKANCRSRTVGGSQVPKKLEPTCREANYKSILSLVEVVV